MTIWRVRERASFDALRRSPRRVRRGSVSITFAPSAVAEPRVAFAIQRGAGSAVERNRFRRRVRAICRDLARDQALPTGDYLVSVRGSVSEMPFDELRALIAGAVDEVAA